MVETITEPHENGECVECSISLNVGDFYVPGEQGGKTCIPCAMDLDLGYDDDDELPL